MKWNCLVATAAFGAVALIGGRAAADPPRATTGTQGVTTPAPPANPTATTTTTAADVPADAQSEATAGPVANEPTSKETVTVKRAIRPNLPWLITGSALLVGTYVPTAVIAGADGRPVKDRNLLIPVVGPWLNLANRQCTGCANETRNVGLVIGSGVLQGLGVALSIASFFIPDKIAAATIEAGPVKMNVLPTQMGQDGMGVGSIGVF